MFESNSLPLTAQAPQEKDQAKHTLPPCNVLIVDDERLSRLELKRLLTKFAHVSVVGEANSAKQALTLINSLTVDVIFLDIQMPQMTGLELAETFASDINFVFCTAFNEHAVDAFALNAIDYLVKPVNPERLQQTLKKIAKLSAATANKAELLTEQKNQETLRSASSENDLPANYLPENHGILLKFGESSKIVRLQEIERFESIGNHVAVYSNVGKSYLHSSLSKVERRLDPVIFFKASRSDVIRIDNIEKIEEAISSGSLIAIMQSGQEIEVSRRQSQQLKQMFSAW